MEQEKTAKGGRALHHRERVFRMPDVTGFEVSYYFRVDEREYGAYNFPPHMHDALEIYVLLEGDVSFTVEHNLYHLQAGDAIITKPNEIHNCILNAQGAHKHLCLWFSVACEPLLKDFLQHDFGKDNLICPSSEDKKHLLSLYEKLRVSSEKDGKRYEFSLFLQILETLGKSLSCAVAPQQMPAELQVILSDINDNFLSIKSLSYFTEKHFISQSTLNRLFRTYLHTTPGLYLEAKRLAHSRLLLKKGKSVLAACMESGFSEPSNYIRLFKKRFGITPGQYRES